MELFRWRGTGRNASAPARPCGGLNPPEISGQIAPLLRVAFSAADLPATDLFSGFGDKNADKRVGASITHETQSPGNRTRATGPIRHS